MLFVRFAVQLIKKPRSDAGLLFAVELRRAAPRTEVRATKRGLS